MTRIWYKGKLVDVGDDDEEAILLIAKTIEAQRGGHMIDRWEFELSEQERKGYLQIGATIYRKLVASGRMEATAPASSTPDRAPGE